MNVRNNTIANTKNTNNKTSKEQSKQKNPPSTSFTSIFQLKPVNDDDIKWFGNEKLNKKKKKKSKKKHQPGSPLAIELGDSFVRITQEEQNRKKKKEAFQMKLLYIFLSFASMLIISIPAVILSNPNIMKNAKGTNEHKHKNKNKNAQNHHETDKPSYLGNSSIVEETNNEKHENILSFIALEQKQQHHNHSYVPSFSPSLSPSITL